MSGPAELECCDDCYHDGEIAPGDWYEEFDARLCESCVVGYRADAEQLRREEIARVAALSPPEREGEK